MILKMKYEEGWTLVPIPSVVQVENNVLDSREEGEGELHECKIKIYNQNGWDISGVKEPEKIIVTYDEAYLLSNEGKTIERIN